MSEQSATGFGASARPKRVAFGASASPALGSETPPTQAPAARPQTPGVAAGPAVPQAPSLSPAAPNLGVDFGGTNDPAMNEWLNQQAGMLDYPRHPKLGTFLTGPYTGKSPGQVRETLVADYRAGRRNPVAGPGSGAGDGGGLRTGTMTGKSSFTPSDVWANMTKPGQIQRPASTMPGSNALSPAAAAVPAMTATNPAAAVMTSAAAARPAAGPRLTTTASPAIDANNAAKAEQFRVRDGLRKAGASASFNPAESDPKKTT